MECAMPVLILLPKEHRTCEENLFSTIFIDEFRLTHALRARMHAETDTEVDSATGADTRAVVW